MILFRSGRPGLGAASSLDIDVAIDLGLDRRRHHQHAPGPWRPPVEVIETESALEVRAEIGGIDLDQFDLLLAQDVLSIRGERRASKPKGRTMFHESRIRYGHFEANVHLPFPVNGELASAEYIDGMLTVVLPRQQATTVPARCENGLTPAQRGEQ